MRLAFGILLVVLGAAETVHAFTAEQVCEKIKNSKLSEKCLDAVYSSFYDSSGVQVCDSLPAGSIAECMSVIENRSFMSANVLECYDASGPANQIRCLGRLGKKTDTFGRPVQQNVSAMNTLSECRARLSRAEELVEAMRGSARLDPAMAKFLREFIDSAEPGSSSDRSDGGRAR